MSARWDDGFGEWETDTLACTQTTAEAGAETGIPRRRVAALAAAGRIGGVKVGHEWRVDPASLRAHLNVHRRRHLPAEPLLAQIRLRGGKYACGVRSSSSEERLLLRAQRSGWVSAWSGGQMAEQLLGMLAWELWPDELG